MAALPSRKSLENMKRAELQRICKDYGVKANLKSEALIDLLLDTQKPPNKPTLTRRTVSTKLTNRPGPSRVSSVIIHDTDEEDIDEEHGGSSGNLHYDTSIGHPLKSQSSMELEQSLPPMTRTRKAKEQTRLGVGRPVAAGGTGPRAVTKSLSVSRPLRGKRNRSVKPSEETILEEFEPEIPTQEPQLTPSDNSRDNHTHLNNANASNTFSNGFLASLEAVDKHVADALRPLYSQVESLRAKLEAMQSLKTEFDQLKTEVDNMGILKQKVEDLAAEVVELRTQATSSAPERLESKKQKGVVKSNTLISTDPQNFPSTPVEVTYIEHESEPQSNFSNTNPLPPATILGKRHRDLSATDTTGEIDLIEDDHPQTMVMPTRKRPKILVDENPEPEVPSQNILDPEEINPPTRISTSPILSGQDESPGRHPNPQNTEHIPHTYSPSSHPNSGPHDVTITRTSPAPENPQAFHFSFFPASSSSAHGMFMPSFPYPEPPQSPSPAGSSATGVLGHHQGGLRDTFQAFGLPSPALPSRPSTSRASGPPIQYVDPAELTSEETRKDGDVSSLSTDKVAGRTGQELPASRSVTDSSSTVYEMKRTMYGTELDGDTRFGDFGVEGVGTSAGFWTTGRY